MSFARVLRDVIDEDNGLLLRVTAHERMLREKEKSLGWSERVFEALKRRSRKIFSLQRAEGAFKRRSKTCH